MPRLILAAALVAVAAPVLGQTEKEVSCGYQSEVVAAVQKARIDKIAERDVQKTVLAGKPGWPENYNAAIPLVAPWVYELPMKQVRENDLGDVWGELCLKQ